MATKTLTARKKRVLDSVFGAPVLSQPTPVATPATGFAGPGQAFGVLPQKLNTLQQAPLSNPSFASTISENEPDHSQDQFHWDRSWHTVTHGLIPPDIPKDLDPTEESQHLAILKLLLSSTSSRLNGEWEEAVQNVVNPNLRLPLASHVEDIYIWYTNQVRSHFLHQILPLITHITAVDQDQPDLYLLSVLKLMAASHQLYVRGMKRITTDGASTPVAAAQDSKHDPNLCRDLHAIMSNSVTDRIADALKLQLKSKVYQVVGLRLDGGPNYVSPEDRVSEQARSELMLTLGTLRDIGLSGETLQTTLAEIMHEAMSEYVTVGCTRVWSDEDFFRRNRRRTSNHRESSSLPRMVHRATPSRCITELCDWIENRYAKLIIQIFDVLKKDAVNIPYTQVEQWKEMGIGRLANLRTNELFDIVASWPESKGALEDLKIAITSPQKRLHLTDVFASTLNQRLLHPGASTLQILRYYISMISSFHALDHSKVLLDRVAHPLQVYLYSREDTVRVIIAGLLSDINAAQGAYGTERLYELATLLENENRQGERADDDELDWHDKDWMPDPVDAGPGYKRSKTADIIGTLIRVLGTQEVFIKEFQTIIGENLIKFEGPFERENKVLDLLKSRFGDAPLQSCEVMLKDIKDSLKVDDIIRRAEDLMPTDEERRIARERRTSTDSGDDAEGILKPSLHTKILSRFFWPQLHDETYRIPNEIAELQRLYENGFETLKSSRKLTWLPALGFATVELDLADRVVVEEVHSWQATVIYAFQSDEKEDAHVTRSVKDLVDHLEMEEALVRSALKFWVHKIVLHEVEKDVYGVLETLNTEDRARSNAQASANASTAPDEGADDANLSTNTGIPKENKTLYWQFIQGMLKNNSSQMPLQQISMMLQMMLPDKFPYTNEDLQEFLSTIVAEGVLEFAAGKYKLKK